MPYTSKAQQGWAHTPAGTKALGGPEKVAEWDHASKGLSLPARKGKSVAFSKGSAPVQASYAAGGPVLGRTRDFMKEPDAFRSDSGPGARQDYGQKGAPAKRTGDKGEKAVLPRK